MPFLFYHLCSHIKQESIDYNLGYVSVVIELKYSLFYLYRILGFIVEFNRHVGIIRTMF